MITFKQLLEQKDAHLSIVTESAGTPMYTKHIGGFKGKNYLQIAIEHHKSGALDSVIKDLDAERRDIVANAKSFKAGMLHDHAIKGLTAAKKHLPETEKAGPESGIPSKLKTESIDIAEVKVNPDDENAEGGFQKTKKTSPPKDDADKDSKKIGKKKLSDLRTAKSTMKDMAATCEDVTQVEEEGLDENWYHPVQVGEFGDGTSKVKLYRGKGGAIVTKHYLNGKLITMEHKHGKSRPIGESVEISEDEYAGVEGHSAFKKKKEEEKPKSTKGTYGNSHSAEEDEEKETGAKSGGYSNALGVALGDKLPKVPDEKKMKQLAAAGKARIVKQDESTDIIIDKVGVVFEFYVIQEGEIVAEGSAPTEGGAVSQAKRMFEALEKATPALTESKTVVDIAKRIAKSV